MIYKFARILKCRAAQKKCVSIKAFSEKLIHQLNLEFLALNMKLFVFVFLVGLAALSTAAPFVDDEDTNVEIIYEDASIEFGDFRVDPEMGDIEGGCSTVSCGLKCGLRRRIGLCHRGVCKCH